MENSTEPRIIGTLYDADRHTAWLGANDFVYRWWSKEGWGHPQADGHWSGIHKSNIAAAAAGEPVMSYSLIYRLNSPRDFEHQGPYISIADLDNPPDRATLLDEPPMDERDRRFGLGGMPRP